MTSRIINSVAILTLSITLVDFFTAHPPTPNAALQNAVSEIVLIMLIVGALIALVTKNKVLTIINGCVAGLLILYFVVLVITFPTIFEQHQAGLVY